ncbi:MAG: hypothetical protein D6760_11670 [Deltaproteobacteria bacterium]|nr:MAG: hypothetical protein D6760_11670 [Deltaproteobacteria bacterium]
MRKLLFLIAVIVAAACGVGLSSLRGHVAALTGTETVLVTGQRAEIEAGSPAFTLRGGLGVRLPGVRVVRRAPKGKEKTVFAESPFAVVRAKWLPLLAGRARVAGITVEQPTIRMTADLGRPVVGLPLAGWAGSPGITLSGARFQVVEDIATATDGTMLGPLDIELRPGREGGLRFEAQGALLGDASTLRTEGRIRPGAGPTGGSAVEATAELRGGDVAVLSEIVPNIDRFLRETLDVDVEVGGFAGERSTELVPAEPLTLEFSGSTALSLFGHQAPLRFDASAAVDDKRYLLRKLSGTWGGIPVKAAGWRGRGPGALFKLRLSVEDLDVAAALAELGVAERWRVEATASGTARAEKVGNRVVYRYDGRAPEARWEPIEGWPVEAGKTQVTGTLFAVNADVSAAFTFEDLRVRGAWFDRVVFGGRWWRDKLDVGTNDLALWDGKVTLNAVYFPKEDGRIDAGGIIDDIDAASLVRSLWPQAALDLSGRLDALLEGGRDAGGPRASGRVAVHWGKLGPVGLGHAVIDAIGRYARHSRLLDPALVAAHSDVLSPARMAFKRIRFDFQTRDDGVLVRGLSIEFEDDDLDIRAEGLIGWDGVFAGWGVMTIGPSLTAQLARRLPELGVLGGSDGRLRIPVTLRADEENGLTAEPGDAFLAALDRATRGEKVPPFAALVPEDSIEMDLPSLEEHFGR